MVLVFGVNILSKDKKTQKLSDKEVQNVLETKIWQCCITITNKLIRLTSHDTKHLDPASTNKHHLTFSFEKWARFPLGSNRCALAAGTSALGSGCYKHTYYTTQTYIQYKNTPTHTRTWYLMVQTHTIQNIKHTNTCIIVHTSLVIPVCLAYWHQCSALDIAGNTCICTEFMHIMHIIHKHCAWHIIQTRVCMIIIHYPPLPPPLSGSSLFTN